MPAQVVEGMYRLGISLSEQSFRADYILVPGQTALSTDTSLLLRQKLGHCVMSVCNMRCMKTFSHYLKGDTFCFFGLWWRTFQDLMKFYSQHFVRKWWKSPVLPVSRAVLDTTVMGWQLSRLIFFSFYLNISYIIKDLERIAYWSKWNQKWGLMNFYEFKQWNQIHYRSRNNQMKMFQ